MMAAKQRLTVLISFSGEGGVERMVLNLIEEFATQGIQVDLLMIRAESAHLNELPASVRVIKLDASHNLTSVPALARYLRNNKPAAMLVAKDRAGRAALWARLIAGVDTRIVIRLGTNLSAALKGRSWLRRWSRYLPMRISYRMAEKIVAVSQGVADDTHNITHLPTDRITVIRNPVVTSRITRLASETVDHPWLINHDIPVIVAAGRFTRQKDFNTLVRAFAHVREQRDCRLIILGEGSLKNELEILSRQLSIDEHISYPGFQVNPYAWLAKADLFVLSSAWEGSPNVLTEALAVGTPVVSTDCPSGPREILQDGHYGPLVEVGDHKTLADAILKTLDQPLPADTLRAAVTEYTAEISARRYLDILGL